MIQQLLLLLTQTWTKTRLWVIGAAAIVLAFFLWGSYQNSQGYKQCRRDVEAAPKETTYVTTQVRLPADSIAIEAYKAKLAGAKTSAFFYRAQYEETARMYRQLADRLAADSLGGDSLEVTVASLDTVVQDKGDTTAIHVEYYYPPVNEFRNLYIYSRPRYVAVEVPAVTRTVFTSPPQWSYAAAGVGLGAGGYFIAKEDPVGAVTSLAISGAIYYFFMRE